MTRSHLSATIVAPIMWGSAACATGLLLLVGLSLARGSLEGGLLARLALFAGVAISAALSRRPSLAKTTRRAAFGAFLLGILLAVLPIWPHRSGGCFPREFRAPIVIPF